MNKYQRVINQLVKDDIRKEEYANMYPPVKTKDLIKSYRKATKGWSIDKILDFKKWNKDLPA